MNYLINTKRIGLSLILVLFGLQSNLIAQNNNELITITDNKSLNINLSQINKIDNLKKSIFYKKIQFVKIGSLTDFITQGELTFNIPDKKGKFKAHVKEFRYFSEKNYVWKGDLINKYGSITIISENGKIFGYIAIENQYYEIQDIEDKNIFIEFDLENLSKCNSTEINETRNAGSINQSLIENNSLTTQTGLVRVLILYTPAAKLSVSNIERTATIGVSQFNEALRSSGISASKLSLSLVGTFYVDFTETAGAPSYDIDRISQNAYAKQLRNQYQADLVVLLTAPVYGAFAGVTFYGPPTSDKYAYNIVSAPSASASYLFTHELGHFFGCDHEKFNAEPPGSYAHAHLFTSGWWLWKRNWKTVMSLNLGEEYTTILHFSNPNVEHWSNATGTATANNSRKLVETSSIVENLRPYSGPPIVNISGPSNVGNGGTYTWLANVQGGLAPYSYNWEISDDGVNYFPFSSGQGITSRFPFSNYQNTMAISTINNNPNLIIQPPNELINYLKLTVTDYKGEIGYDFLTIIADNSLPPVEVISAKNDNNLTITNQNSTVQKTHNSQSSSISNVVIHQLFIFPNPAQNSTRLEYKLDLPGKVKITVINSFGAIVQLEVFEHEVAGQYFKTIQTSSFKNGLYFIKIESVKNSNIYKLIVEH